jgi:hypothetical protein
MSDRLVAEEGLPARWPEKALRYLGLALCAPVMIVAWLSSDLLEWRSKR